MNIPHMYFRVVYKYCVSPDKYNCPAP